MYYDRTGEPITSQQWAILMGKDEEREVAFTRVGNHTVSTVWLGIEHFRDADNNPYIFETLVQGPEEWDESMVRYTTLAAAEQGHETFVQLLRNRVLRNRVGQSRFAKLARKVED